MHVFAVKGHARVYDQALKNEKLSAPCFRVTVLRSIKHDSRAFTQGLFVHDGRLYETTGRHGQSSLRMNDFDSGETIKLRKIDIKYFGEGACTYKDKIFVLTWVQKTCLLFNVADFSPQGWINYSGEGWGLTFGDGRFIQSDGSSSLIFRNPETFREQYRIAVRDGHKAVNEINELEYVDGLVLANIWRKDLIAAIDPADGEVRFWLDLSSLRPQAGRTAEVANGIAWDPVQRRLFVTGKLWNKVFEIKWPIESEG